MTDDGSDLGGQGGAERRGARPLEEQRAQSPAASEQGLRDDATAEPSVSRERQLVFDFPGAQATPATFFVTEANRDAARLVRAPQLWAPAACVVGPHGSGKTHLARELFANAPIFPPAALSGGDGLADAPAQLLDLVGTPESGVALDNVDEAFGESGSEGAERALFHIFNRAAERGAKILLLARTPPARWPVALPDLRTRLRTAPVARIEGPDDALLAHLLRKRFGDLGFTIEQPTVQYLLARLPRSFEAIEDAVQRVDARAWSDDQVLTIHFIRNTLGF